LQCVPSRLLPANYVAGIVISETQLSLAFILDAPPFLTGLYGLLIGAAPYMGLGCFVAAAVSFRSGGGANFEIGGGFTNWIFWGMVFLALPSIPLFLKAAGIPWQPPGSSSVSQAYLSGLLNLVQYFTNNYLVSHLVPVVAAALVLKALLDSAEGNTPIPSLVSALLVLSVQALWTMANSWNLSSDQYGVADGLMNLVNWAGSNVCPAVGALCVIGAVVNFVRGKPWGHLAIASIAMMCFSGIWLLVKSWG